MRILVAGGTGAVGRRLVPMLVAAGHDVTGLGRSPGRLELLRATGARALAADVLDASALRRVVADAAPDVVVHQLTDLSAAVPADNGRVRREGTRNLVDAALAAGVRRMLAQSISWAYAPGEGPAEEPVPLDVDAPGPRASMVGSVAALEAAVAEVETHVVLRYGILYGPGTWYAPDGAVAAALAGRPDAPPFLGSLRPGPDVSSFLHVDDAARAAVAALEWPSGPVNVVDDEPAAGRDWLPVLSGALGVPAPAPVDDAERTPWARGASNALARARGWAPRWGSWREGFPAMTATPGAGDAGGAGGPGSAGGPGGAGGSIPAGGRERTAAEARA